MTYDLTEYWYSVFVGAIKLVRGAKHGTIVTTALQFALQDNGPTCMMTSHTRAGVKVWKLAIENVWGIPNAC